MLKKIIVMILLIAIISFNVLPSIDAAGDPMTAQGYQITIWKYDGSGSPTKVGKPILVYHSDLFGDVFRHATVSMPGSYDSLVNNDWEFSQLVDLENDWYDSPDMSSAGYGADTIMEDLFTNPNNSTYHEWYNDETGELTYTESTLFYYTYDNTHVVNYPKKKVVCGYGNTSSGHSGYYHLIIRYSSKERKITYKKSGITNLGDYYALYEDNNVEPGEYIDNLIKNKYFKNVQSVKTYFGIDIDYKDMDKYYVSVEPVQRVLDGIKRVGKAYLAKSITHIRKEEHVWTSDTWEQSSSKNCDPYDCNCGYDCDGEEIDGVCYGTREWECDTCYDDYSYTLPRKAQYVGIKNIYEIYGRYADGYSHIATSRSLGSSDTYLNRAVNYCGFEDNKHCELEMDNVTCKKDGAGNTIYQYYVGPSLEKALVGTLPSNPFLLNGDCTAGVSGNKEKGIKHYYLEDLISCENVCGTSLTDKRSDEYLKCAENYCDAEVDFDLKGNARLRKKDCILSCGYSYGKSPVDGSTTALDRESVNSCNNANPYRNLANRDIPVKVDSTCSVDNNTGKNTEEINGLIVNCDGDKITDFDGDDTNDRIFDQRGYINIACRETSAFGFLDLTNKRLVPGQGIDYWSRLTGEKECTAFFDLEQWKFDYATISSQDPDRRKRLLYIYDVFNNELNDLYNKETNGYYDSDFAAEGDGEINWNKYEYKTDKVSVVARVKEIIDNIIPNETTLERYELGIEDKDNSVNATIVGKEEVKEIYNMNVKTKPVNKYVQTSRVNAYYKFGKYCVSKDGLATVTPAPENGVCDIVDGRKDFGKNLYYTDLNATEDEKFSEEVKKNNGRHEVLTEVTVGREVVNEETYYEDGENCPYKIDGKGVSCTVVISSLDGTIMHGNSIYVYGGVRAKLKIDEKLGTESIVSNYGIVRGETALLNGLKETVITISDKKLGVEKIPITGIVETSKGYSVICDREIHIIDPHDDCGVSCSVEKYEGNDVLYEIISPEPGNVSQTQVPKNYYTALSTNMNWVKVLSNTAGKYLVRLSAPLGNKIVEDETEYDETILYGKVEGTMKTSGAQCFNVCWTEPPELPNCEKSYKPVETNEIKNHCEKYWNKDVNDYESVDECIFQCSNACPDDRRDYELVEHYCRNNYEDLGFEKASSCVNYCYYCPECSSDYIFRQVNNYNPFPRSEDSNTLGFNYATGDRVIGSNWVGKSQYIKADDDDTSSVTGINKNQKVEYVIELTPNDVRAIREDTEKYNEERKGNDAYLDYVYMKNVDTNKRYYSKFINETFYYTFTMVNGEVAN